MKVSIILAHPNPGSFNHAIAKKVFDTLKSLGHEPILHDLYQEKFDPILIHEEVADESLLPEAVKAHCDEIRATDGLVFVHPNWWGTPPAILKGWLDRVVRQGLAYKFGPNGATGFFTEKIARVYTTSNTPRDVELNFYGDPLENFWKTVVFGLCGCKSFNRINFEPIIISTPEQRTEWLRTVENDTREAFA